MISYRTMTQSTLVAAAMTLAGCAWMVVDDGVRHGEHEKFAHGRAGSSRGGDRWTGIGRNDV